MLYPLLQWWKTTTCMQSPLIGLQDKAGPYFAFLLVIYYIYNKKIFEIFSLSQLMFKNILLIRLIIWVASCENVISLRMWTSKRSLIRAFKVLMQSHWTLYLNIMKYLKALFECVASPADLHLYCSYKGPFKPLRPFSRGEARLIYLRLSCFIA